jgi:hypothetical protein
MTFAGRAWCIGIAADDAILANAHRVLAFVIPAWSEILFGDLTAWRAPHGDPAQALCHG